MKYGEMTFEQIKDAVSKGWLVILPVGCTEQQGPGAPEYMASVASELLQLQ